MATVQLAISSPLKTTTNAIITKIIIKKRVQQLFLNNSNYNKISRSKKWSNHRRPVAFTNTIMIPAFRPLVPPRTNPPQAAASLSAVKLPMAPQAIAGKRTSEGKNRKKWRPIRDGSSGCCVGGHATRGVTSFVQIITIKVETINKSGYRDRAHRSWMAEEALSRLEWEMKCVRGRI